MILNLTICFGRNLGYLSVGPMEILLQQLQVIVCSEIDYLPHVFFWVGEDPDEFFRIDVNAMAACGLFKNLYKLVEAVIKLCDHLVGIHCCSVVFRN